MKLYYPSNHYNASYRGQVFPLLKAFIKNKDFTDMQRVLLYGISERDFEMVDTMDTADIVVLPMSWNYYVRTKQMDLAYTLIQEAKKLDKKVWSINTGDFGVKIPYFRNLLVYRQSGYVANKQLGHKGFPSIIEDYLHKHQIRDRYLDSVYGKLPIVGFCGQTNSSKLDAFKEMIKQVLRNLGSRIGLRNLEPQKISATSFLRANLLKKLESNKAIDSRFIKRKHYRAGVTKNKETHISTKEFYCNMLMSQYVLCVRGAGNFSVRFYETLMMGRIPLYVHTDGYLPLNDIIDWKNHVVWVDYKDRHRIADILLEFHSKLDQEKMQVLFENNRRLWKENLTLSGFFKMQKIKM